MTHLRRSLLPLAMAMLLALATVAGAVDAVQLQAQSSVAEGFEPATHPPAWDQEPAVVEDLHKYWQAALTVEVAPVAQKRVRSASPSPSASSDASLSADSAGADEANRVSEQPQKRRRVESVASTNASPLVSLAAGGRVTTPPARKQTAAQRLASFKRKLAKADQLKPRQTRTSTARQSRATSAKSRVAKAKSLISVDSAATATVSLGVYPPAPLQMPLNGPRLFVRNAQITQNPTLAVATQVGKSKRWMIGGFMYTLDVHDRVKSAGGMVNLATVPRPPLAEAVDQFCDAMYYPSGPFKGKRPRKAWQSGHIVAFNLGGSNTEVLNFYPQQYQSNSSGGKWWRIELIAGAVRAWFEKATKVAAACPVQLQIAFDYNHGKKVVAYASGGLYAIGVPTACFAPMQAALKLGAAKKYGGLNSYAQAFAKNAKAVGTQVELSVAWINAPDKATVKTSPQLFA